MKSGIARLLILTLFLIIIPFNIIYSQELKSISGQQDINVLMATAQKTFDFKTQDAVILFDGKRFDWMPDGRLVEYTHQIIWIGTDYAIEHYGDRRLPFDAEHCSFKAVTVRTWRDNQWWETGETGIVETLPADLQNAYDYTNMREMMLLHIGIEIPCILEVAYVIEDKAPFRKDIEGIWSFKRNEPSVATWFGLGLPIGIKPQFQASPDVPGYEIESDEKNGLNVYWWKMGPLEAIPAPRNDDFYAEVPYIAWSTWSSWKEYGDFIANIFKSNTAISDSLAAALDTVIMDARTPSEKAGQIAEFIGAQTQYIDYPERFWTNSPRIAVQTFNTAYGHRLDRAILATALFGKMGFTAIPIYISVGPNDISSDLPSLGRMNRISLVISDNTFNSIYDPSSGALALGNTPFANRTIWLPGLDIRPRFIRADTTDGNDFYIRADIEFDSKNNVFKGTGYIHTGKMLNIYGDLAGVSGETKSYLGKVLSGLFGDAKITDFNPDKFDENEVSIGFAFEFKKPDLDDFDRLGLAIGEPIGGLIEHLPANVKLYDHYRTSGIYLPDKLMQKIEIRLKLDGLELVYFPEESAFINDCGSFKLMSEKNADRLILTRELELTQADYSADKWQSFRALLLNETNEKNKTVILKAKENKKAEPVNAGD